MEFFVLRSTIDCSQEVLTTRLWLEAVCQGLLRASQVVWLSDDGRGYGTSLSHGEVQQNGATTPELEIWDQGAACPQDTGLPPL